MTVSRRHLLGLALAAPLLLPLSAKAEAPLTILLPYSKGAFEALVNQVAKPLETQLGRPVVVEKVTGEGSWDALERLRKAGSAPIVLADADLSLAIKQEEGARGFSFEDLRPVAKLTNGLSFALIAPAGSTVTSWAELESSALPLRIANTGAQTAFGVAQRLLSTELQRPLESVPANGPKAIYDLVASGDVDLGIVTTNLIEGFNAENGDGGVVPVITFGGARSPRYPEVPTLAEVSGDDKKDFTISLGFYGNAEMDPALAADILKALQTVQSAPEVADSPLAKDFPMHINPPEVLRASYERDVRLLKRLNEE